MNETMLPAARDPNPRRNPVLALRGQYKIEDAVAAAVPDASIPFIDPAFRRNHATANEAIMQTAAIPSAIPSKDLALAGLIHDLNNVFQTIVEAADLLSGDPKWLDLSNKIIRSVERGKGITGSLDDSTRSADFEAILDRAVQFTEDLRNLTQAPAVIFDRDIEPGLRFRGRALAMERVLVNLLVNGARAATISGQPGRMRIQAYADADVLSIIVCDSGPGIEPEILPLIFEPGFSTRSQSSGLGLHIVRSIVEDHGGEVVASNMEQSAGNPEEVAWGACFTIQIPVRRSTEPGAAAIAPPLEQHGSNT